MDNQAYQEFIHSKSQIDADHGFDPVFMPDYLYDFQQSLIEWSLRKGRSAIFGDCGLGKTPMELVWGQNVVEKTNGNVLLLTPLAVSIQMVREAEKFGIEVHRSHDGTAHNGITVTNYEQLHKFNPDDFVGAINDESSILKNFDGKRKGEVTVFMRKMKYRLLATATAAPNDYIELGTSSEALGYLGHMDMLMRYFKNDLNNIKREHASIEENCAAHEVILNGDSKAMQNNISGGGYAHGQGRYVNRLTLGFDDDGFILPAIDRTGAHHRSQHAGRWDAVRITCCWTERTARRTTQDDTGAVRKGC